MFLFHENNRLSIFYVGWVIADTHQDFVGSGLVFLYPTLQGVQRQRNPTRYLLTVPFQDAYPILNGYFHTSIIVKIMEITAVNGYFTIGSKTN